MTSKLNDEKLADLRSAHLNLAQGVISRLSSFSANTKNFCVTISAALIAIIFDKGIPQLVWAGSGVIIVFLFIDCYYLTLERRYRNLYNDICNRPLENPPGFHLEAKRLDSKSILSATLSTSIWPFYLAILACMIFFGYFIGNVEKRSNEHQRTDCVTVGPKRSDNAASPGAEPVRIDGKH